MGLIKKNNFIQFGIGLTGIYNDSSSQTSNQKNEQIRLRFVYGTKLIYDINKELGLEIHLPYISGELGYFLSESNQTSNKYRTSITFLSDALIYIKFYY